MSQPDRDTIAQKVHALSQAIVDDDGAAAREPLGWLLERALCDLNRIADALETANGAPS